MSINLTEAAAEEVKQVIERRQQASRASGREPAPLYVRVAVKKGGCSGFSYSLELTKAKAEHDQTSVQHDLEVICDPESIAYLDGTIVDFKDGLMERGFVFNNPNVTKSCGCGSSFSA